MPTHALPTRAPDTTNQWPRELTHTTMTIPDEQDCGPIPQPTSTHTEPHTEQEDNESQEAPVTTLRQNCTRLGVVFSHRTLFAWQQRKDQGDKHNITHQDGVIQQGRYISPYHTRPEPL
jgi:hypothetical protein